MLPSKRTRTVIVDKFQLFCSHCSLNGLYYFSSHHPWPVYFIWLTVIAGSCGLCGFLGHMIWDKFAVDPTFTVVETTHYSTTDIVFPSVTVCETDSVYGPNADNITHILKKRGFYLYQISDFYNSFDSIKKNVHPPNYVRKMHTILHDLGYTHAVLENMLRKPCEVLLVNCMWRSDAHSCSTMFREIYTPFGYCCKFDIDFFMQHSGNETNFMPGTEVSEGLTIVLNGQKTSFNGNTTDGYIWLYVIGSKIAITVADSPIILSPAGFFDISINVWLIDTSDDVKTLPLDSRKCLLADDDLPTGKYYQQCVSRLMLNQVANNCHCLPFHYTAKELNVEDHPPCTWERFICVYQTLASVKANIRNILSSHNCYQRCDYVAYETSIDYLRINRPLHLIQLNKNYILVTVHFESGTCMKYRREVLYTWDQMLANLGGIFGLCLGGSIISVIEVVWFLLEMLITLITTNKTKTAPVKSKERVFTLSHKGLKENYAGKSIRIKK